MIKIKFFTLLILLSFIGSCSSYKQFKYITEEFEMPSKVMKATYTQTWQAVIEVMKNFDLSKKNIESGVIKTRWIDNTREVNFVDSFGTNDSVRAAKFKLIVNISKGFRRNQEVSKVTIYRRQLVEQDFLQGWKEVPSDGIQEKVMLYRLSRLIKIDNELKKIEDLREQEKLREI